MATSEANLMEFICLGSAELSAETDRCLLLNEEFNELLGQLPDYSKLTANDIDPLLARHRVLQGFAHGYAEKLDLYVKASVGKPWENEIRQLSEMVQAMLVIVDGNYESLEQTKERLIRIAAYYADEEDEDIEMNDDDDEYEMSDEEESVERMRLPGQ